MHSGPQPRKQPYIMVASRVSLSSGYVVSVLFDRDEEIYYVGIDLTIEDIHSGGPYGCRTCYSREEAFMELENMLG